MPRTVKLQSITPFPPGAPRELLAMGAAELKALAAGRSGRAKAAQAEIARRAANRAVKAANKKALKG